uniref:Uncharacterized protein n=1 Tax=Arundo donax TaxID=35708 RepID=A0A0A9ANJ0_ARUDO
MISPSSGFRFFFHLFFCLQKYKSNQSLLLLLQRKIKVKYL